MYEATLSPDSLLQGDIIKDAPYLFFDSNHISKLYHVKSQKYTGWNISSFLTKPVIVLSHSCEIDIENGKGASIVVAPIGVPECKPTPENIEELKKANAIISQLEIEGEVLPGPIVNQAKYFWIEPSNELEEALSTPITEKGACVFFHRSFTCPIDWRADFINNKIARLNDEIRTQLLLKYAAFFMRTAKPRQLN